MLKNLNKRERVLLVLNITLLLLTIVSMCGPIIVETLQAFKIIDAFFTLR